MLFEFRMEDSDYMISPFNARLVNEEITALSNLTPRDFFLTARKFSSYMKSTEQAQGIGYTISGVFTAF